MGIERPILVGHSFGADIAMYFSLLYPERVPKLLALEPGLAALVHLRQDKDWIGWSAWVAKLEEVGIHVPEDKRTDAEFLLQLSLETPKFYGPARGLPRNREPLLHLIRNTTLMKDYEEVGAMTLDAVKHHSDAHAAGLRARFAFHQLLRVPAQGPAQLHLGAAAGRRAFRPSRAARAAYQTHPPIPAGASAGHTGSREADPWPAGPVAHEHPGPFSGSSPYGGPAAFAAVRQAALWCGRYAHYRADGVVRPFYSVLL